VFYEAHKRNTAGDGVIPRLKRVIDKIPTVLMSFIGYRSHTREYAYTKACFSNQRVLLGAIEMYNMDHTENIDSIDDFDTIMNKLVAEEYLRSPLTCSQNGVYRSYGRFFEGGIIFCDLHGTPDAEKILLAAGMIKPDSIWDKLFPYIFLVVLAGAVVFTLVKMYHIYKAGRSGARAKSLY
jgi:hypothetical protein